VRNNIKQHANNPNNRLSMDVEKERSADQYNYFSAKVITWLTFGITLSSVNTSRQA